MANGNNGIRHVNLALQGGGAHGAFTWGVLDRLLEEDGLQIEGVSGTSAGAMNAAVMMSGFSKGGKEGGRRALDSFWEAVSAYSPIGLVHRSPFDQAMGNWNTDQSPGVAAFEALFSMVSPYQLNPTNWHPLRPILEEIVDFDALQNCPQLKLFVSATNVRTGRNVIFDHKTVTIDALIASACLPTMFQAVQIDGDPYWDGGYTGNPALYPLIYNCASRDIAVVQINPIERPGLPMTAGEIMNRLNEVTFNFSLMAEMRAIAFVQRLIEQDELKGHEINRLRRVHVHMIGDEEAMLALGMSSKYNIDFEFLSYLKELGRKCAEKWLSAHWDDLGKRSSIDIRKIFLGEVENG
jgi:NTE family protein